MLRVLNSLAHKISHDNAMFGSGVRRMSPNSGVAGLSPPLAFKGVEISATFMFNCDCVGINLY